jgi:outer membrane protein TolC
VSILFNPKREIRNRVKNITTICLASVLFLAGCAVGPRYQRPTAEVPPEYKETGSWKTAQPNELSLRGNWWEIFQDPQLNALEQQVSISNQNLKAAQAQYTQARALVRFNRADYFPTVAAGASATRTRVSGNNAPLNAISNGTTNNDFQLPVDVKMWSPFASRHKPVLPTLPRLT